RSQGSLDQSERWRSGLGPQRVEVDSDSTFACRLQQAAERFEAIAEGRRLDGKIAIGRLAPDRLEGQGIAGRHGFRVVVWPVPRANRAAPAASGGPARHADGIRGLRPGNIAARQLFDDAFLQPRHRAKHDRRPSFERIDLPAGAQRLRRRGSATHGPATGQRAIESSTRDPPPPQELPHQQSGHVHAASDCRLDGKRIDARRDVGMRGGRPDAHPGLIGAQKLKSPQSTLEGTAYRLVHQENAGGAEGTGFVVAYFKYPETLGVLYRQLSGCGSSIDPQEREAQPAEGSRGVRVEVEK